jgi:Rrf2 family nitric oxide-sensitive transcriptional repressor
MRLTRATDYAIRVLVYLTEIPQSDRATRRDIVENTGVPGAFLNKLVQRLVRAQFISARPGAGGGCRLTGPASGISILQVIETLDGPLRISECLAEGSACPRASFCNFRRLLLQMQQEMARLLNATTLADMARHDGRLPHCLPDGRCCCEPVTRQPPG